MEQTFSRKSTTGISLVVFGILAIIGGIRHNEYRLIPEFVYYIGGVGFIIFSIWSFLVPYISMDNNSIIIKKSPFGSNEIDIKSIKKIQFDAEEIQISEPSAQSIFVSYRATVERSLLAR